MIMKASRESILKSIQSKIMKDYIKDRFDMILVSVALFKLRYNSIHSSQHENKFILYKQTFLNFKRSSISFTFFDSFIHFKLTWIESLSNCLLEQRENMFSLN